VPVPLLATKLSIPSVRRILVPRPRLIDQLNLGLERKLTLISAPAGYGKTTLANAWLNQGPFPAAWISLDESDNDLARFLTYFVASLKKIHAEIGETLLAMLHSPQVLTDRFLLSALINDIAQFQDHFVLVLDDYHQIQETSVHQALGFLLDHQPEQMHLVILTRADPPLPLARLRAQSQIVELRAKELCFSAHEAEKFFSQSMGLVITRGEAGILAARTEGWIAGLQLAAVSLQGREDVHQFIQNFAGSNRHILDYLLEEVLERQPEETQSFLLKTSILNQLNGSLCDRVTGRNDGQAMLEELDRSNLFVVSLDDQRCWYRYHHLFADLLRQRLVLLQPGLVPDLHSHAGGWFEENGLPVEAIRHAFSAGDSDGAARLIEKMADTTLMRGELQTFLSWVERLPEPAARQRPLLCVYHAEALLLSGRSMDLAVSRLEGAPEYDAVQALIASYRGDVELSLKLSNRALEHLPRESTFLRGAITSALGAVLFLSGDVEPAIQSFQAAMEIGRQNANLILEVIALSRLGQLHYLSGELRKAETFFRQAIDLCVDRPDRYLPIASLPLMAYAFLVRERNDLNLALSLIQKSVELSQESGGFWSVDSYVVLALVLQALGDADGALEAVEKARRISTTTDANPFDDRYVAAYEARLLVMQGKISAAARLASHITPISLQDFRAGPSQGSKSAQLYQLVEIEQMSLVRVCIAQGKTDEALAILAILLSESDRRGRIASVIENRVLQAMACFSADRVTEALRSLQAAWSMAESEGFIRGFVDEGLPMERLLQTAANHHIAGETIARLLVAFSKEKSAAPSLRSPHELIEPLSKRELEILQLIARGLSNREIAAQLVISLSTVKGHTANIFSKLDVKNRTQAVARGRKLALIL
jgi:LuxR family maltose regulon positive regulatory protein